MARAHSHRQMRSRQATKQKAPTRQLLLGMVVAFSTISGSSAMLQQSPPQEWAPPPGGLPVKGTHTPPVLVDGARNPELIDRRILTAQIIRTMVIPPSPTAADERRLHARAFAMDLGRRDEEILRAEMMRLHGVLVPIQARLGSLQAPAAQAADLVAYREKRLESYARLLNSLSPDGRSKLNRYIDQERRNVTVIGRSNQQ